MSPVIHIEQSSPLLDTSLEIQINNLTPHQVVTVQAEMKDNLGPIWRSFAEFRSDGKGDINLKNGQPISGTYSTPDAMGLFWSMAPIAHDSKKNASQTISNQNDCDEGTRNLSHSFCDTPCSFSYSG